MRRILLTLSLTLPTAALAHTGIGAQGSPFGSGFLHPLLGPDHVLTMVAVGILAAMTGGRAIRAYPVSFVAAMVVGGFLGFGGAALPVVEPAILASVVVLGAAVALAARPPLLLACGAIALFGVAHGYAHGLEGPALGGVRYAAGFVVATLLLHAAGVGLGLLAASAGRPAVARGLGGLIGLAGVAMVVA
jgi:urease accessory protein